MRRALSPNSHGMTSRRRALRGNWRPALSAADVAAALQVTPRAAAGMIDDLRQSSGLIRELTGRGAFRFCGVV